MAQLVTAIMRPISLGRGILCHKLTLEVGDNHVHEKAALDCRGLEQANGDAGQDERHYLAKKRKCALCAAPGGPEVID